MSKVTIFDSEGISIHYYPDKGILVQETHKFTTTAERRRALIRGYQLLKRDMVSKWITNNVAGAVIPPQDVEWGVKEWFPRAIAAGLKHWAVILPSSSAGQMSGKRMVDSMSEQLNVSTFADEAAAVKWLETC